ncbi:MAG: fibronectin type III domain-containing protein, partial [Chloroflexi bacterium]|nr:fibronectin type III domain-containing protein [Chloroflexota bacterium]
MIRRLAVLAAVMFFVAVLYSDYSQEHPVRAATTFTVTSTGDSGDSNAGNGICDDGSGSCTLRAAIEEANALSGTDTIAFNISTSDPGFVVSTASFSIKPGSALPTITDPVVIDGYTQPGASPNTNGPGFGLNTVLKIELDGSNAGAPFVHGLNIHGGASAVRGLVINRFSGDGVFIAFFGSNVIEGNFLGTDISGTLGLGNTVDGIDVRASNNTIGGITPAASNVLSSNGVRGVVIQGAATGNLVQGNFIGTDVSGTFALGNAQEGVVLRDVPGNTIGGTQPGAGNVISGNGNGVRIVNFPSFGTTSASQNVVIGNIIGADVSGTANLGNIASRVFSSKGSGVVINGASGNTVGGTETGAANIIAFNEGNGIRVVTREDSSATGNWVLNNSIFSNGLTGIDLEASGETSGVTPNDVGDSDTGSNNLQNFPVLTSAVTAANSTVVEGSLNSASSKTFKIEFFSNSACDPSGHGEGEAFVGTMSVTTDGGGNAGFTATLSTIATPGHFLTATATDPEGNTSEFSRCLRIPREPDPPTSLTAVAGEGQAMVSWTAPSDDGGSPITEYTVTSDPGGRIVATADTSTVMTELTNGESYVFTVVATNAVGPSESSSPSNTVVPIRPPDPPTNVEAVAGDGQATVSWTAPSDDGGSPIAEYTVTSEPGGLIVATADTSTVVTELTNGESYVFTVVATNAAGVSKASSLSNVVVPIRPPDPPTNVDAMAGDGQVTVSWTPPIDDGGSPITAYTVTSDHGGLIVATTDTSTVVTEL